MEHDILLGTTTRRNEKHGQYGGFWLAEIMQKAIAAARTRIKSNPPDILLASLPKSGTTWLKALAFATLNRATHSPSDAQHPLRHHNPHDCVGFLEMMVTQDDDEALLRSPRPRPRPLLVQTHVPYSLLPDAITAEGSGCRLVYVCRDPKDMLVSFWNFYLKEAATLAAAGCGGGWVGESAAAGLTKFADVFELFCEGRYPGGPYWRNALEFWHESQRRPNEVLFLRYEDMLGDPVGNLKKLAAFMGCAFSEEEEEAGVVEQIVELCSLASLKSMDVNKNGSTVLAFRNVAYFRKGQVGDWKNYMTLDMAARLDKIVEEATRGSGLTFAGSVSHN
ncbi:cytosolic sulfotransferase 5-like [Miscanthus floridulus]|uniref:cytosolic sulfotransferase 5-like n=1 Tax=Miscanthus floridulus TaxID=154761 RepID=UPI0034597216